MSFPISQTHKHKVIGVAQAGSTKEVKLHEYGGLGKPGQTVQLQADGKVDEFVRSFCSEGLIDLDDRRIHRFVSKAIELTRDYQPGGSQAKNFYESSLQQTMKKALAGSGLDGLPRLHRSKDGFVGVNTALQNSKGQVVQSLNIRQGTEERSVSLATSIGGHGITIHRIQAPLQADAAPDLARVQESLEIQVPWFDEYQLKDAGEQTLQDILDPRLAQATQAAEFGRRLTPEALGSQWSLTDKANSQVFTHAEQTVTLDLLEGSVIVQHKAYVTGSNAVQWKDGLFKRGFSQNGVDFGPVYGSSVY